MVLITQNNNYVLQQGPVDDIVEVLWEKDMPTPDKMSEIADQMKSFHLIRIQFRIPEIDNNWIRLIEQFKTEIISHPKAYKNLGSIHVELGKNCRLTTKVHQEILEALEGLDINLKESHSKLSATTSGLKLQFFQPEEMDQVLEYAREELTRGERNSTLPESSLSRCRMDAKTFERIQNGINLSPTTLRKSENF